MASIKIYNQKIDLKDVDLIYMPKEKACMKLLQETYQNKCFKSSYILEIKNIIKISDVSISAYHLDVRGEVWVTFTAEVIRYSENDLIADCKISKKIRNRVFAETKYGNVILLNHELLKLIKEDEHIPIIVKRARYETLRNNISIFAIPFTPSLPISRNMYVLTESMSTEEIDKISSYIDCIKELEEWIKKLKTADVKKYKQFDKLFYPFKKPKKPTLLTTNKKDVSLLNYFTMNYDKPIANIIIIPSPEISQSEPFVLKANIESRKSIEDSIKKQTQIWNIVEERSYVVFESLLISHIKYLTFLRDMVKNYDLFKETSSYWKAMISYKQ